MDLESLCCPICASKLKYKNDKLIVCKDYYHAFETSTIALAKPTNFISIKVGFATSVNFTYSKETDCFFISDERVSLTKKINPFKIRQIKEVCIEENNIVLLKTSFNPTAMVAGGVLFGGLGAIAGSKIATEKTKTKNKDIYKVSISIDSLDYPGIKFETKDGDSVYKLANALKMLREKYIKTDDDKKESKANEIALEKNAIKAEDIPDILRKYKSLYDDGILTEGEYIEIKKKLLDL